VLLDSPEAHTWLASLPSVCAPQKGGKFFIVPTPTAANDTSMVAPTANREAPLGSSLAPPSLPLALGQSSKGALRELASVFQCIALPCLGARRGPSLAPWRRLSSVFAQSVRLERRARARQSWPAGEAPIWPVWGGPAGLEGGLLLRARRANEIVLGGAALLPGPLGASTFGLLGPLCWLPLGRPCSATTTSRPSGNTTEIKIANGRLCAPIGHTSQA